MIGRKNGKNSMIPGALSGDHEYRDESGTSSCGFKITYTPA
jgi:hypothetical protein